ncbi:unnamed protein product [Lasius platythorax]|uniref:Uncharacterized protein n=1 Tax=Lasius platythorax TaxID=488582 RepID=A0AAV2NCG7_9HYME
MCGILPPCHHNSGGADITVASSDILRNDEKDTEVDDDATSTLKPREIRTGKRRKRTSPGAGAKKAKKREERGATPQAEEKTQPAKTKGW